MTELEAQPPSVDDHTFSTCPFLPQVRADGIEIYQVEQRFADVLVHMRRMNNLLLRQMALDGAYAGSADAARTLELLEFNADYDPHDGLTDEISQQSGIIRSVSKIVGHIGGSATLWQTVAALEAKLREAERGLKSAVEFAKAYAPRNDVWADAVRNELTEILAALQSAQEETK